MFSVSVIRVILCFNFGCALSLTDLRSAKLKVCHVLLFNVRVVSFIPDTLGQLQQLESGKQVNVRDAVSVLFDLEVDYLFE